MQALGPPPGGRPRHRKAALHMGAVLPHELLAKLAESGELVGEGDDARLRETAAPEPPAELPSMALAAGDSDDGLEGLPLGASAPAAEPSGGEEEQRQLDAADDDALALASGSFVQLPAAAGSVAAGAIPADQLPAYTSLARQKLQQRLKAAIAAGARPGSASAARRQQARPQQQQPSAAPQLGGRTQPHGPGPPDGTAVFDPSLALPGMHTTAAIAVVPPSQHLPAVPLPLPSLAAGAPADLGGGFSLPLPRSASPAACLASAGSAQPHWLAGKLLRQPLYHDTPRQHLDNRQRQRAAGGQQQGSRQQPGVQRGLLALLMPPLTAQFAELMPVRVQDGQGGPSLLVLPSDGPSSRQEAEAAAAALRQLLADPAAAAPRAAAWRQQLLLRSSSAALLGLTADYAPLQHVQQLRQQEGRQAGAAGMLAGPSWLAGSGSGAGSAAAGLGLGQMLEPASLAGSSGPLPAASGDAVQAVRSSSSFLRADSRASPSRSSSPLPPLMPSRAPSRLGASSPPPPQLPAAGSTGLAVNSCSLAGPCWLPLSASAAPSSAPASLDSLPAVQVVRPASAADEAWDAYCCASLAAGLAAFMSEAVRQVEVGCAERGRLLAQLWNAYTGVLAATIQLQQERLGALEAENANLSAEAMQLRWENSTMSFLRTEIGRLRKDKETVALELDDCRLEAGALREAIDSADEERQALEEHVRRRLAALRWRHAAAAVLVPGWRSRAQGSSCSQSAQPEEEGEEQQPADPRLQQLAEMERLAAAAVESRQQRAAAKQSQKAEAALAAALSSTAAAPGHSSNAGVAVSGGGGSRLRPQSRLQQSSSAAGAAGQARQPAASGLHAGNGRPADGGLLGSGAGSLALLRCLRPEARALLLLGQPPAQRQQLLAMMSDGERAALAVQLDESARLALYDEMGSALAVSTDAVIGRKPLLLARHLANMPPEQAATHFASRLTPAQQAMALQASPAHQAAQLLLGVLSEPQRQRLLKETVPSAAAELLEWLLPAVGLQLLLGCAAQSGSAGSGSGTSSSSGTVSSSKDGSSGPASWEAGVLEKLADRHLSAMLAVAAPAEVATLLQVLRSQQQQQQRLLGMLSQGSKAAALASLHQREAAAAREREARAGPAGAAAMPPQPLAAEGSASVQVAGAEASSEGAAPAAEASSTPANLQQAARPATPPTRLDPALALLAHFQQLSAAEKTSVFLMGSAQSAALLLPLLGDDEVADVLLLLPHQRQEQILAQLHPEQERRIQGVAREARRRRSSLLLPQQLSAAVLAAGLGAAQAEAGNAQAPAKTVSPSPSESRQARGSVLLPGGTAQQPAGGGARRRSALSTPADSGAAAAAGGAGGRRRSSLLNTEALAAAVAASGRDGAAGGRRRSAFAPPSEQPSGAALAGDGGQGPAAQRRGSVAAAPAQSLRRKSHIQLAGQAAACAAAAGAAAAAAQQGGQGRRNSGVQLPALEDGGSGV